MWTLELKIEFVFSFRSNSEASSFRTFSLSSTRAPDFRISPTAAKWHAEAFRVHRGRIFYAGYMWGNPVAMRQIVFFRHMTRISALPPNLSGPPRALYSHIYLHVYTLNGGGVSDCRRERRDSVGPPCETKQLRLILNWELGTGTNSLLSSSSCMPKTWKRKKNVSNAWNVSI